MKALVLTEVNQPLSFQEMPTPECAEGNVLVQITHAAINHRDVWIRKGMYAGIRVPCILGSDAAGRIGDREVILSPSRNWGKNQAFQGPDFEILGIPNHGTFAEYLNVLPSQVFDKPAHLTLAQAAALPLAGLTAYRAMFVQARLRKSDRVLITGIGGGVAAMALQFAVANGNQVWVTSSKLEKIANAIANGAQAGVLYTDADWVKQLKSLSNGIDVVIDGTAGAGLARVTQACNPGARIVLYGGTAGAITDLNPQQIFWKQISLIGSTMGSDRDFARMLAFVAKHKIVPPVSHVLPLSQGNAAFDLVEQGKQSGKVVLEVGG
jgi:zinc-binding alcohol dehydrogenase/oxidoreductase